MNDYEDEETIIRWLKIEGSVFKDAATINEFGSSELEKLAKDKDANTRLAVAANSRTPVFSLTVLSALFRDHCKQMKPLCKYQFSRTYSFPPSVQTLEL